MKIISLAGFRPLVSFLLLLAFVSCQKDAIKEQNDLPAKTQSKSLQPITIGAAKNAFQISGFEGVTSRDYETGIQDITPIWDAAIASSYAGSSDILIVPLEPYQNRLPGAGANLIFFRDQDGLLDYRMLVHIPEPGYWAQNNKRSKVNNFTGAMIPVAKNGKIGSALLFNQGGFIGIGNGGIQAMEGEVGCDDSSDPDCPQWGSGFWNKIGNFFGNIWGWLSNLGGNGSSTNEIFVGGHFGFGGIKINPGSNPTYQGGGGNSTRIIDYFDLSLFEGIERKNAQMINQFKENYCISNPSPALLGELTSSCGFSDEPEELFFELKESLFGGFGNLPECVKEVIVQDILGTYFSGSASASELVLNEMPQLQCASPILWDRIGNIFSNHNPSTFYNVPPGSMYEGEEGEGEAHDLDDATVLFSDCNSWNFQPVGPGNIYQACGVSGMHFNFFYMYENSQGKLKMGFYEALLNGTWYFEFPKIRGDGTQISSGYAATFCANLYDAVESEIENEYANRPPQSNAQQTLLENAFINKLRAGLESQGGRLTKINNYGVGANSYETSILPTYCN